MRGVILQGRTPRLSGAGPETAGNGALLHGVRLDAVVRLMATILLHPLRLAPIFPAHDLLPGLSHLSGINAGTRH